MKFIALSLFSFAAAAPGNVTALCALLTSAPCSGVSPFPASYTPQNCVDLFNNMTDVTAGDDTMFTMDQNTIGCRYHYAMMATNASTAHWCRYGAPTGGGLCGSVLNNTCSTIFAACDATFGTPYGSGQTGKDACVGNLSSLAAIWGSKQGTAATSENSLECRAYHATAALAGGAAHCTSHTALNASVATVCDGNVSTDVMHHCTIAANTCNGTNSQYPNDASCMAAFGAFPNPASGVTTVNMNTQGCRQYHMQAAATLGVLSHCAHGGPSGGTQCGTSYEAWVSLAGNSACSAPNYTYVKVGVEGAFGGWLMADLMSVIPAAAGAYAASPVPAGDNEFCRVYHLSVAATGGSNLYHCDHGSVVNNVCADAAAGGPLATVCRAIIAGCGTTAPNGAYATVSACVTAMTPVAARPGNPTMMAPTDDSLACRMYQASLALVAKKGNMTMAVTTACAAARATTSSLCGGMAPAKSSATSLAVSALFLVPIFMM